MLRGFALCLSCQPRRTMEMWQISKSEITNIYTVHETLSKFMIDSLRRIEKQEWCSISRQDSYFFFIKEPHLHHIIINLSPKDQYNTTVELWTFWEEGEFSHIFPVTGFQN